MRRTNWFLSYTNLTHDPFDRIGLEVNPICKLEPNFIIQVDTQDTTKSFSVIIIFQILQTFTFSHSSSSSPCFSAPPPSSSLTPIPILPAIHPIPICNKCLNSLLHILLFALAFRMQTNPLDHFPFLLLFTYSRDLRDYETSGALWSHEFEFYKTKNVVHNLYLNKYAWQLMSWQLTVIL